MRILGIDPGYALVGFGVLDYNNNRYDVVDYGVISTPKEENLPNRLMTIAKCLEQIIDTYKPDVVAVEELFFFKNQKTVIPVAEARGVIILTCMQKNLSIFEYTPLQIKQALTGNGRAEKAQIQFMTKTILGLEKIPKPDDAADAIAVAICHSQINPMLNINRVV
ncbi:MAG: crossover junction endodeoxyribonuclease RuvC [Clostridia bacterium]|nr:crossover junction endodeoxyribonuclease RuvC [Clostridia bacterium]